MRNSKSSIAVVIAERSRRVKGFMRLPAGRIYFREQVKSLSIAPRIFCVKDFKSECFYVFGKNRSGTAAQGCLLALC